MGQRVPVTPDCKVKDQWLTSTGIDNIYLIERLYPNPAKISSYEFSGTIQIENISL